MPTYLIKLLISFAGCVISSPLISSTVLEPHCSKFHYEEKLLEKMIRMEISVETMKKEIEKSQQQVATTLEILKQERTIWETSLIAKIEKRSTDLASAVQESKTLVQDELKLLEIEKDNWSSRSKEFVRIPELVLFSARNSKETSLRPGVIMVFKDVLLNEGGAYNNENGVFTVLYAGVYTFSVQLCVYKLKYVDAAFLANGKPFQMFRINRHDTSGDSCFNFDAMTMVGLKDEVKLKITSCDPGVVLHEDTDYYWNTLSGRLVYAN